MKKMDCCWCQWMLFIFNFFPLGSRPLSLLCWWETEEDERNERWWLRCCAIMHRAYCAFEIVHYDGKGLHDQRILDDTLTGGRPTSPYLLLSVEGLICSRYLHSKWEAEIGRSKALLRWGRWSSCSVVTHLSVLRQEHKDSCLIWIENRGGDRKERYDRKEDTTLGEKRFICFMNATPQLTQVLSGALF